jgi:hypothetical protein
MTKRCVYCGKSGPLTREHVFPESLSNAVLPESGFYFIGGANKKVLAAPTIRDVCATCNNVTLSALDSYGKELAEIYFGNFIEKEAVTFEYKYDVLLKWLLKVLFNANRAFKAPFSAYIPYIPYILGNESSPPHNTNILIGLWKPSFYKGKKYYPREMKSSNLLIPGRGNSKLLLASMLSLQSYAFIILGWADDTSAEKVQSGNNMISDNFGAIILSREKDRVVLDPNISKLDHITDKLNQAQWNPWLVNEIGDAENLYPDTSAIILDQGEKSERIYCKTALITVALENDRYAVVAWENIHPRLIVGEFSFQQPDQVVNYPYAVARIHRINQKTYVEIVDLQEIGNPFFGGEYGILQSQENWIVWQEAIIENESFLIIGTLPADLNRDKIKLASKIRVVSIEEKTE